ncbi:hypothetical protein GF420_12625 [candidate division GN15 bacterium]|nr:hypothetical protein [candidate division GN15 bacterium]
MTTSVALRARQRFRLIATALGVVVLLTSSIVSARDLAIGAAGGWSEPGGATDRGGGPYLSLHVSSPLWQFLSLESTVSYARHDRPDLAHLGWITSDIDKAAVTSFGLNARIRFHQDYAGFEYTGLLGVGRYHVEREQTRLNDWEYGLMIGFETGYRIWRALAVDARFEFHAIGEVDRQTSTATLGLGLTYHLPWPGRQQGEDQR